MRARQRHCRSRPLLVILLWLWSHILIASFMGAGHQAATMLFCCSRLSWLSSAIQTPHDAFRAEPAHELGNRAVKQSVSHSSQSLDTCGSVACRRLATAKLQNHSSAERSVKHPGNPTFPQLVQLVQQAGSCVRCYPIEEAMAGPAANKQPELSGIEGESSFISWYNSLEQVRDRLIGTMQCICVILAISHQYLRTLRDTGSRADAVQTCSANVVLQKLCTMRICRKVCLQDARKLRIFDRKTFYTVHGQDTAVVAKLYGGNGAVKQLGKAPNQLASIALNRSLFEQLLRSVLVESANRVVELYEGHGAVWRLARHALPPPASAATRCIAAHPACRPASHVCLVSDFERSSWLCMQLLKAQTNNARMMCTCV